MTKRTRSCSHLTIGLDLGNKNSDYCLIDAARTVLKRGQVGSHQRDLKRVLGRYPGALVVFEVGAHSRWVQPLARKLGLRAIAADPRQLALISKSYRKNDKRDAHLLALAGSALPELLHPVEHKNSQFYADLGVLETRGMLTEMRTKMTNRVKGVCKAEGHALKVRGGRAFHKKAPEQVPEHLRPSTSPIFKMLEELDKLMVAIDKDLENMALRYPTVAKLRQICGVGIQTALTFVLTICDPSRFHDTRAVGAYLGLVPRQHASGDINPQLPITKAGDGNLRRLLVLCGHYILGPFGKDCHLRQWGLALCERGGKNAKKRACVAVARKLAVLMLALWKSEVDYDPSRNLDLDQPAAA